MCGCRKTGHLLGKDIQAVFPDFGSGFGSKSIHGNHKCQGQTTEITFIFRTSAHPISTMFIPPHTSPPATGAQAVKMLPFLHPWCCHWNNSPLSRESLHYCWGASFHLSFPAPRLGGRAWRSAVCCVCSLCAREEEDEESRLGSVTATLRGRAFLLLCSKRLGGRGGRSATSKRFPPFQPVFSSSAQTADC